MRNRQIRRLDLSVNPYYLGSPSWLSYQYLEGIMDASVNRKCIDRTPNDEAIIGIRMMIDFVRIARDLLSIPAAELVRLV